jgi:hypothetical protein
MAKEFRTAEQLSDMIVSALGIKEAYVQVRKDHAYGWQPTILSCPVVPSGMWLEFCALR